MEIYQKRLQECFRQIREAYRQHQRIPTLVRTEEVPKSDSTFLPILVRAKIEKRIFKRDGPELACGTLGQAVAMEEERRLITTLLKTGKAQRIKVGNIDPPFFFTQISEIATSYDDASVIFPARILPILHQNLEYGVLKYSTSNRCFILESPSGFIQMHTAPDKPLFDHLLIFHKVCISWLYQSFPDEPDSEFAPTLSIQTTSVPEKPTEIELQVYSMIKFSIVDQTKIRAFKIIN